MAGLPRTAWVLGTLVVVGVVLLLLACVTVFPRLLIPNVSASELKELDTSKERLDARDRRRELQNNARTALLQGVGGAALLLGLWFTWHQTNTNVTVTRQGQIAERFGRAIDQLSGSSTESRLGGIYGLEAIAKQEHPQRPVVAEVLVAYVRSHAPRTAAAENEAQPQAELRDRLPDVQAALTVLKREGLLGGFSFNFAQLDLRRSDLRGADLRGTDFNATDLRGSDLRGADLRGANLSRSSVDEIDLDSADMRGTNLQDVTLLKVHLPG